MSPPVRTVVTFALVIMAVLLWGAAGVPTWYDRAYLADIERGFAALFFLLAIALNVLGGRRQQSRPHPHVPHHDGVVRAPAPHITSKISKPKGRAP